jgi:hypothetical protein
MCVCAFFCVCVVLCSGRGLATSWSPVQGVLQSVNDEETEKSALCSKVGTSSQMGAKRKGEKKGAAWLITMGPGFDDWVYWHFFTIAVNYKNSHIEFLLNDVCLTNEFFNNLQGSLYRLARIHGNPCKWFVVTKMCLPKRWLLSNRDSAVDRITLGMCLPERCLANGHIPSE